MSITSSNARGIAYKLRQGKDNGDCERDALALYLEGAAEYMDTNDSIIEKMEERLRKANDEILRLRAQQSSTQAGDA